MDLTERLRQLATDHLGTELGTRIAGLARPADRLLRRPIGANPGPDRMSRLGGEPMLPTGVDWPTWHGEPLPFLALVDLSEIGCVAAPPRLLNFFYAAEDQPWGYEQADAGGWRVIGTELDDAWLATPPEGLTTTPVQELRIEPTLTLPSWEEDVLGGLSKKQQDGYDRLVDAWREVVGPVGDWPDGEPDHRVGGWPSLIQSPLWPVAQLASNGLDIGHSHGYSGKQAAALRDGIDRWRLLLQLDTDDELDWMWGDVGRLYFVIAEESLKRGSYDASWMVLQCT